QGELSGSGSGPQGQGAEAAPPLAGGGAGDVPNNIGTLQRGNINANIVGGVPQGYAGHHLVGVAEANRFPVMHRAAELGYDINRGSNGIALPTTVAESAATGLPLHTGRHVADYERYVNSQLNRLQRRYDAGRVSDSQLPSELGRIEDNIRNALLARQVRLQHADPN
ncbi:hypothetical protein CAI21_22560, partial [Alkalilimnicola ehrlichii]